MASRIGGSGSSTGIGKPTFLELFLGVNGLLLLLLFLFLLLRSLLGGLLGGSGGLLLGLLDGGLDL